ncbi:MAG: ABC transporter substrate-binding protein, partial [Ramlibacter sp.]
MKCSTSWGWKSLAMLALCASCAAARAADIVVAQVAPLSGVLASTGHQMVVGGNIYFSHINARGG